MTGRAYLDYNATAPLRPEAASAMAEALELWGNPSSVHSFGRAARHALEQAREAVAGLVAVSPERVIFTSGGTEANNLALAGVESPSILLSAGEHDSLLRAAPDAEQVPLTADGLVDLAALEQALERASGTALVCLMLANNETGVIQPVAEAAALAHRHGARLHCDAVQAAGRIPIDCEALGADLLALSAHKLGGPKGAGALIVGEEVPLTPLLRGGGQERRRRAGTENVPAIAGFGVAARLGAEEAGRLDGQRALRDGLERSLAELAPEVRCFGVDAPRLPNTACVTMPGVAAETQVMALDLAGVAVSAGAACSSGKVEPSHVLQAMGVSPEVAATAIRVSLGWASGPADISLFLEAWKALYERRKAA